MRLMTLNKIYRAFPELDEFSDEDCRRWVAAAQRQNQWVTAVSVCVVWLFGAVLAVVFLDWFTWVIRIRLPILVFALLWIGFPILSGCIPAFMLRDAQLRMTIRRQVTKAMCSDCGFSLLGLPTFQGPEGEYVRCPECGVVRSLKGMQLTKDELLSGIRPPMPEPALLDPKSRVTTNG